MDQEGVAELVSVDRAVADVRRGSFVVINGGPRAAVIAQAAETVSEQSLATLTRLGNGQTRLALTAERAGALALLGQGNGVVTLPLDDAAGVETIRGLTDPTAILDGFGPARPVRAEGLDSTASAAIGLSKLAQLLPAALTAPLPASIRAHPAAFAAERNYLCVDARAVTDYPEHAATTLRPVSEARVPLEAAENARLIGFRPADGSIEQFAIVVGDPAAHQPALCRLHSECFTGDLLGSLRCDCGPQLQSALRTIGAAGHGVVLYLAHEGRGIGLINKLRAYQLQDRGLDTIDANHHLGFGTDERSFQAAAVMLRHLGIDRVRLLTNNPGKIEALPIWGVEVVERIPLATPPNRHNHAYLATKAARAGHLL